MREGIRTCSSAQATRDSVKATPPDCDFGGMQLIHYYPRNKPDGPVAERQRRESTRPMHRPLRKPLFTGQATRLPSLFLPPRPAPLVAHSLLFSKALCSTLQPWPSDPVPPWPSARRPLSSSSSSPFLSLDLHQPPPREQQQRHQHSSYTPSVPPLLKSRSRMTMAARRTCHTSLGLQCGQRIIG